MAGRSRCRAVVFSAEAQGLTLSFSTLTNGDADVLSACFLGSAFTSVSSLKCSEEPSDISYFCWPPVHSPHLSNNPSTVQGQTFPQHSSHVFSLTLYRAVTWPSPGAIGILHSRIRKAAKLVKWDSVMGPFNSEWFGTKSSLSIPRMWAGDAVDFTWWGQPKGEVNTEARGSGGGAESCTWVSKHA